MQRMCSVTDLWLEEQQQGRGHKAERLKEWMKRRLVERSWHIGNELSKGEGRGNKKKDKVA